MADNHDDGFGGDGDPSPDADTDPSRTEPMWALRESARVERELLTASAFAAPGGWSAHILERLCPGPPSHQQAPSFPDGSTERLASDSDSMPRASGPAVTVVDSGDKPTELDAAGLLDGICGLQRLISWAQAAQQYYIAALARPGVALPLDELLDVAASPLGLARDIPDTPVVALLSDAAWGPALRAAAVKVAAVEVGCALHLAPVTARSRTERAVIMADELPATLASQYAGDLDGYRASIIADRMAVLDPGLRRVVELAVLPTAASRTPSRVRELVDREVDRVDPGAAARREQIARHGRGVRVDNGQDGMGTVRADVSAPDAQLSFQVLDRIAAAVQAAGLAAGRGRGQIRADVFAELFRDLAATGAASIHHAAAGPETSGSGDLTTDATGPVSTDNPASTTNTPPTAGAAPGSRVASEGVGGADGTPGCVSADAPARPDPLQAAMDRASGHRPGSGWVMPVCVNVYVHASTLAGWDDSPAELAGHGVITADFARALAESAGSIRAIAVQPPPRSAIPDTDRPPGGQPPGRRAPGRTTGPGRAAGHSTNPIRARLCGTVLDAGRAVYRAPKATADYVTARDRICTFAGCRARAERCDLDHRLPWHQGGATCPCNQDPLCRFHHLLKTFTCWRAIPGSDGILTWTSPLGRRYRTEPGHPLLDHRIPDRPPESASDGPHGAAGPGGGDSPGHDITADPPPF